MTDYHRHIGFGVCRVEVNRDELSDGEGGWLPECTTMYAKDDEGDKVYFGMSDAVADSIAVALIQASPCEVPTALGKVSAHSNLQVADALERLDADARLAIGLALIRSAKVSP